MYVSPRHPRHADLTGRSALPSPGPSGDVLATLDRGRSGDALIVALDEYEGHPFVSLRVWASGEGGARFPTKKGLSIRVAELGRVIAALQEAEARVLRDAARRSAEGVRTPIGARSGGEFDEFRE